MILFIIQKLFFWVKHNEASLVQNMFFCFLNSITWKQKPAWVVKNFLINSVHLYSIEKVGTHFFHFYLNRIRVVTFENLPYPSTRDHLWSINMLLSYLSFLFKHASIVFVFPFVLYVLGLVTNPLQQLLTIHQFFVIYARYFSKKAVLFR